MDVKGQVVAKRALEIAVAGGHNILMCGTPGAGKTLLAKCVPTIMPDMTFEEAIETTKIHSIAGLIDEKEGMITVRPFRSPHHTASLHSLTGGGTKSRPVRLVWRITAYCSWTKCLNMTNERWKHLDNL